MRACDFAPNQIVGTFLLVFLYIIISYITCNQIMHAEQVLKSQFNIDITCSQIMHAEQIAHLFIKNVAYAVTTTAKISPVTKYRGLKRYHDKNITGR